jgi:hypothetical protein
VHRKSLKHILGVPFCWRSKALKGVILSSNEAEKRESEAVNAIFLVLGYFDEATNYCWNCF